MLEIFFGESLFAQKVFEKAQFFMEMNDAAPFGVVLFPYFLPCFLLALVLTFACVVFCAVKKAKGVARLLRFVPFTSLVVGVFASLAVILVVGMYSIIFKGEFM